MRTPVFPISVALVVAAICSACSEGRPPIRLGRQGDSANSVLRVLRFSSDGNRLAVLRDVRVWGGDSSVGRCESTGVYVADLGRRAISALAVGDQMCALVHRSPFMSVDTAFQYAAIGSDSGVGIVHMAEQRLEVLTSGCVGMEGGPAMTADGSQLAFAVGCEAPTDSASMVIYDRDRRQLRTLARVLLGATPSWSTDGRRLALVSLAGTGRRSLLVLTVDSGSSITLTDGNIPSWSPDGRTVAFVAGDSDAQVLMTIRDDGTDRRLVVRLSALSQASGQPEKLFTGPPVWHPLGDRLVIGTATAVWELPLDLSPPRQLVVDASVEK